MVALDAVGAVAPGPMQHTRNSPGLVLAGKVAALSVITRRGVVPLEAMARSKNLRAATMSRVGDT